MYTSTTDHGDVVAINFQPDNESDRKVLETLINHLPTCPIPSGQALDSQKLELRKLCVSVNDGDLAFVRLLIRIK